MAIQYKTYEEKNTYPRPWEQKKQVSTKKSLFWGLVLLLSVNRE